MYIGVDGGGTKTAFILIDHQGQVLAKHQEATCSYLTVGIEAERSILEHGINTLLEKSDCALSDVNFAFFGLSAYGEDQQMISVLNELPASYLDKNRYRCDNDMVCGWAGSLGCDDGINIIAGTGSISYGENMGLAARCGGWGELFSDEGSGYWIANEGLKLFTKMSDGRIARGPLHAIIKKHFSLENDLDLPGIILDKWKGQRDKIAALSTLISQAAIAGDMAAMDIFSRAGAELAEIVEATRHQLKYGDEETVKLSYSGGIFTAEYIIMEPFKAALKSNYSIIEPRFSPVIGAALYAAKCDGFTFTEDALTNLAQA